MSEAGILEAIADGFEAAAMRIRRSTLLMEAGSGSQEHAITGAVDRARVMHPMLGHRQAEILALLEEHGPEGTNTGVISRAIDYDQPNVYLTLHSLITLGFVQRDETRSPHVYRLTSILGDDPAGDAP